MSERIKFDYTPSGQQLKAHGVLADAMLFGGAAGGGKSHWARSEHIMLALTVPGSHTLLLRQTMPEIKRAVLPKLLKEIPPGMGKYHYTDSMFKFHNGSVLELGYLNSDKDLVRYLGAEYQLITFEEATSFPKRHYDALKGRLRSDKKLERLMLAQGLRPRMLLTSNPGGIGHHWVKRMFVDPVPGGGKMFRTRPTEKNPEPETRIFIPAKATDNPYQDANYLRTLNQMPENLRRIYRDGDWDALEGVRFPQWRRDQHMIDPSDMQIPTLTGQKCIAVDYGVSSPSAMLWMVKLNDDMVVVYREIYEKELTAVQQAELILKYTREEEERSGQQIPIVMDPAMWNRTTAGAPRSEIPNYPTPGSPAHSFMTVLGRVPHKANNERVNGWALLDEHLRVREDGEPRLLVMSNCSELIRTLPALPRDSVRPEDVDTNAEDHAPDALRYGLNFLAGRYVVSAAERRNREQGRTVPLATQGLGKW